MKIVFQISLLLLLVSCTSLDRKNIPWQDGKYIENQGTLDEITFYQKDAVKWFITLESRNKHKFEYAVEGTKTIDIESLMNCTPAYEYQPTPTGEESSDHYKRVTCNHLKNFGGLITLITKCIDHGKGFVPAEIEKLPDGANIYVSCSK